MTDEASDIAIVYKNQQFRITRGSDHYTVYNNRENDIQWIQTVRKLKEVAKASKFSIKNKEIDDYNINLIAQKAEIHQKASIPSFPKRMENQQFQRNTCTCGCKKTKGPPIPFCSRASQINFLGSAIVYYFFFCKMSIILLAFTAIVYSIFSFGSNMIGEQAQQQISLCNQSYYCQFKISTSIINKFKWIPIVLIQYWLGVLVSVVWIVLTWYMSFQQKRIQEEMVVFTDTPSEKAIKIQNLPPGQYSEQNIRNSLQNAWLNRQRTANERTDNIKISAIHIVYNMSSIRELIQNIQDQSIDVWDLYKKTVNTEGQEYKQLKVPQNQYLKKKFSLQSKINELKDAETRFCNDSKYRENLSTTCAIVQFGQNQDQLDFMKHFGVIDSSPLWLKIKIWAGCQKMYKIVNFYGNYLKIQKAAQPEDVYWKNAEKPYSYMISIGIVSIAGLIVLLTLGVLIGVDFGQNYLKTSYPQIDPQIFSIISFCKTILIVIFNEIIWLALQKLVKVDRKHTLSEQMITLITLSSFAKTVNSIVLPFVVLKITDQSFYGPEGVAALAFDFAISNILISNLLTYFDSGLIKRILIWIRCIRTRIIKSLVKNVNYQALDHQIKSVNQFYEGGDFQMSESYTQILVDLFHMAFYAPIQPVIIIIFLIGLVVKWCLKRYLLFNRYNYPKLYHRMVFTHAKTLLKFLPIFLGLGMVTALLVSDPNAQRWNLYIPSGICVLLGLLNAINPFSIFAKFGQCFYKSMTKRKTRLNPIMDMINQDNTLTNECKKYTQYCETSNLIDLLGYRSILLHGDYTSEISKVKDFTQSFGTNNHNNKKYTTI